MSSSALLHSEITVDNYQIVISEASYNDDLVSEVHSLMLSASSLSSAELALLNDGDKTSFSSLTSSQELSEESVGLSS